MKTILILALSAVLAFAPVASAQNANLTLTTLAAAVTSTSATSIRLTSVTGLTVGMGIFVDWEFMTVTGISGTLVNVSRGAAGRTGTHASGAVVFFGPAASFRSVDPPQGTCAVGANPNYWVNTSNGNIWVCGASGSTPTVWAGTNVAALVFNSVQ